MSASDTPTPDATTTYGTSQGGEQIGATEPARLGWVQRLTGTLFSPGATFEDVNRKPTWLVPLVIAIICGVGFMWFLLSHFEAGWRHFMQKAMESRGPAPTGQDFDRIFAITKWSYLVFAGLGTVLFTFATAGIFALGMMFMQAQTTFKKVLSVVTWSWAVTAILQVGVTIASVLFRGSEPTADFNPQDIGSLSAANLASFMPDGTSPFVKGLASSIDVFSIWFLVLLAIGLTAVAGSRKIKSGSVGRLVFGLWLVAALLRAGMAAVFTPGK